jgi:hypothetical protein
MRRLLNANSFASSIQQHYETYPKSLDEFEEWVKKAHELWAQKKVAVKKLPDTTIEYH